MKINLDNKHDLLARLSTLRNITSMPQTNLKRSAANMTYVSKSKSKTSLLATLPSWIHKYNTQSIK